MTSYLKEYFKINKFFSQGTGERQMSSNKKNERLKSLKKNYKKLRSSRSEMLHWLFDLGNPKNSPKTSHLLKLTTQQNIDTIALFLYCNFLKIFQKAPHLYSSIHRCFATQRKISIFYLVAESRILQYCFYQQPY